MSSIITSTLSGMNALQDLINNTTNNITSSQKNIQKKQISIENSVDPNYLNPGVKATQVYDKYIDFINNEAQQNNTQISEQKTNIAQLTKLEALLHEKSTMFTTTVNELYDQIQEDIVLKHNTKINDTIEDKLSHVIIEMRDFDQKMTTLELDIKNTIQAHINHANEILNKIQAKNKHLRYFSPNSMPKKKISLLHERDDLENELQKIIPVKIDKNEQEYKISLSDGKCLINNKETSPLISIVSNEDPKYISVAYQNKNNQNSLIDIVEPNISSGSLGALLKFSKEDLYNTRNKIGQLSLNCLDSINSYHMLGYDQDGSIGEKIFQWNDPEVISTHASAPPELVSASWNSTSDAKSSDYEVTFKNNTWTVKRLSDNEEITPIKRNKKDEYPCTSLDFDGITLTMKSRPRDGDLYEIKPYNKIFDKMKIRIKKNTPFAASSTNNKNQLNYNNALIMSKFNEDWLVNKTETLDQAYKNLTKSIVYKRHILEEKLTFKEKLSDIFDNKQKSMSKNIQQDYQTLSYQQKCYTAHSKVLQVAEKILNQLLSVYH